MRKWHLFTITICIICSCTGPNNLLLTKYHYNEGSIDTLAYYPKYNISLLKIKRSYSMGDFDLDYVFMGHGEKTGYKIDDGGRYVNLSKTKLGLVSFRDESVGWFDVKNRKIGRSSKIDSVGEVLQKAYPKATVVGPTGVFEVYEAGELIKQIHLGEALLRETNVKYVDLPYGIYRVDGDRLLKKDSDASKLFEQPDGLYFVPSPGYGAVRVKDLDTVLQKLIKMCNEKRFPEEILIE